MFEYIGEHFVAFTIACAVAFILVLGSVSTVDAVRRRVGD